MRKDLERPATGRVERLPARRRAGSLLSPWFDNVLDPFDFFDSFLTSRPFDARPSFLTPELDIDETDKEYIICADMPGVSKDDISIDSAGNQISISAVRRWDKKSNREEEQGQQTYRHSFTLPTGVETDKVEANYADGVLKIIVPKGENLKSRRIKIGEGKNARLTGTTEPH